MESFLPGNWRDLAASTGALKGLRKDKSAENLLRVLLIHLGYGHRCFAPSCSKKIGTCVQKRSELVFEMDKNQRSNS